MAKKVGKRSSKNENAGVMLTRIDHDTRNAMRDIVHSLKQAHPKCRGQISENAIVGALVSAFVDQYNKQPQYQRLTFKRFIEDTVKEITTVKTPASKTAERDTE